jgi:hypothetical protein
MCLLLMDAGSNITFVSLRKETQESCKILFESEMAMKILPLCWFDMEWPVQYIFILSLEYV